MSAISDVELLPGSFPEGQRAATEVWQKDSQVNKRRIPGAADFGRSVELVEGRADDHRLGSPADADRPAGSPSRRVLVIVEDDPDDLFFLQRALRKAGMSDPILSASDGSETLRILSRLRPDVKTVYLVLDIKLPEMSGFDLVAAIRDEHLPQELTFAFLTGNRHPRLEICAMACGARAFFNKPSWHEDWTNVARALCEMMEAAQPAGSN